ncbi:hypothetical protein SNEBB_003476 [Seison nebaliae]|nr:hypothetical protein SNEBB_003476 [Seison nebaliae]
MNEAYFNTAFDNLNTQLHTVVNDISTKVDTTMAFQKYPTILPGLMIFSDPHTQSAKQFISVLESLTPNYDNAQRLAVLRNHISGSVRTLVLTTDIRTLTDWTLFKASFIDTFSCRVDTATLLRQFYQFKKRSSETWFDCFTRLLAIAQKVKLEDTSFDVDKQCFHLLSELVHPAILDTITYQAGRSFQSYFSQIITFIDRHPELFSQDKLSSSYLSTVQPNSSVPAASCVTNLTNPPVTYSAHQIPQSYSSHQHFNAYKGPISQYRQTLRIIIVWGK